MSTKAIEVYSIGICYASVCAHESLGIEDVTEQINTLHPTGTMDEWQPSRG